MFTINLMQHTIIVSTQYPRFGLKFPPKWHLWDWKKRTSESWAATAFGDECHISRHLSQFGTSAKNNGSIVFSKCCIISSSYFLQFSPSIWDTWTLELSEMLEMLIHLTTKYHSGWYDTKCWRKCKRWQSHWATQITGKMNTGKERFCHAQADFLELFSVASQ